MADSLWHHEPYQVKFRMTLTSKVTEAHQSRTEEIPVSKTWSVKPPAVFQSDEEVDTNFGSDSDYIESDQAPEQEEIQRKYAFLQNHPP